MQRVSWGMVPKYIYQNYMYAYVHSSSQYLSNHNMNDNTWRDETVYSQNQNSQWDRVIK